MLVKIILNVLLPVIGGALSIDDGIRTQSLEKDVFRFELGGRPIRELASNDLSANRVHVLYDREWAKWIYVVTDSKGRVLNPREALAPGSVLRGSQLGGEATKRYQLDVSGKWKLTGHEIERRVWVKREKKAEFRKYVPKR